MQCSDSLPTTVCWAHGCPFGIHERAPDGADLVWAYVYVAAGTVTATINAWMTMHASAGTIQTSGEELRSSITLDKSLKKRIVFRHAAQHVSSEKLVLHCGT